MPTSCPTVAGTDASDMQYDQFAKLAGLLTAYQDVFSRGDNDVEQTDMGEYFILLLDGTRPIRQPSRRLGLEKD